MPSDAGVDRRLRGAIRAAVTPTPLYFHPAPWLVEQLSILSDRLMTRVHLDHRLADLVGLVVSQDNSCRYCFAAQRAILRLLGFTEERIARLEHDLMLADLAPQVKAALDYARRISRSNPLCGEDDLERLRAVGFDDDSMREIASLAALNTLFNRTSTLAALPPDGWEALPDTWWARTFRPLLALVARGKQKRGAPRRLEPAELEGPFAFVIASLDGLPIAGELRASLDAMWSSPILTRGCKAFQLAVVARALGCPLSEKEAMALLSAEGVGAADVEDVLDHLSWSGFTPQEAALVPLARETVWYQTQHLQRRAREVRDRLTLPEFVEAIGVLSLANVVCRLGAALAPLSSTR
jgi:AhpD family alkylhydroperoxidase